VTAQEDPLAGRLGGTLASFKQRFGDPVAIDSGIGAVFESERYGVLGAEFDSRESLYDDGDPALIITFGPARTPGRSGTEPDDADWPLDLALTRAEGLLPRDATIEEPEQLGTNTRVYPCRSAALETAFGELSTGECRVVFLMPTETTVSYATATLTSGAALAAASATPERDACEGFAGWASEASARLGDAQARLGTVTQIDEEEPVAPEQLRDLAGLFRELATSQRQAEAPDAAARASYYLISAFAGYASAVEKAAGAIEAHDGASMESAVRQLGQANDAVDSASAEIASAAETCGLLVATPEAG
jgi:hypothetical protein